MFQRRTQLLLMLALTLQGLAADRLIPAGYYNALDGKSEAELKTAVFNIINPHTLISSYSNLPRYFEKTDVYPQSSRWWDMYSDIPLYAPKFSGLNREHSFPKSWWGGSTDVPAYIDLNHLYPAEAAANMAKSNYPLGEVDMTKPTDFNNGISIVGTPVSNQGGGAKYVFEPDDQYKGDFARTYFYMVTCYQNMTWKYQYMVNNNTYPTLNTWSQNMLLRWSREDPVSQKEIDRNEVVYSYQNNRNPFIDFPELAEYLWGNKKGETFILSEHINGYEPAGDPILINPTQGSTLEFGEVAQGRKSTAKLLIHGENLTAGSNLRLRIYDTSGAGGDEHFNIDGSKTASISSSAANAPAGIWVTVEYNPQSLGVHEARLVVTGGGISGSTGIGLHGQCLEVPELTAPTATAATDITPTSYTANWTPVDGEVVDYWVVNRTKYIGGSASTEQLVAEDHSLPINDFCGSESYTVQSVRLGIYSPESNSISVSSAGITTVESDTQVGFIAVNGGVLVSCTEPLSEVIVYTPSGRRVSIHTNVNNNDKLELSAGVYLIVTKESPRPVKVIVRSE